MTPAPTTTNPADGTVEHRDGRTILRYERRLRHPVGDVWAALTEPARLREWLADADLALRPGGAVQLRWLNTDDEGRHAVMDATITELDPPRVLELAGEPHGTLRFELTADGPATVLVLTVTRTTGEGTAWRSRAGTSPSSTSPTRRAARRLVVLGPRPPPAVAGAARRVRVRVS